MCYHLNRTYYSSLGQNLFCIRFVGVLLMYSNLTEYSRCPAKSSSVRIGFILQHFVPIFSIYFIQSLPFTQNHGIELIMFDIQFCNLLEVPVFSSSVIMRLRGHKRLLTFTHTRLYRSVN